MVVLIVFISIGPDILFSTARSFAILLLLLLLFFFFIFLLLLFSLFCSYTCFFLSVKGAFHFISGKPDRANAPLRGPNLHANLHSKKN